MLLLKHNPPAYWLMCLVESGLFHLQPFMNTYFPFFIIVGFMISQVLLEPRRQMLILHGKVSPIG